MYSHFFISVFPRLFLPRLSVRAPVNYPTSKRSTIKTITMTLFLMGLMDKVADHSSWLSSWSALMVYHSDGDGLILSNGPTSMSYFFHSVEASVNQVSLPSPSIKLDDTWQFMTHPSVLMNTRVWPRVPLLPSGTIKYHSQRLSNLGFSV